MKNVLEIILKTMEMLGGPSCSIKIEYSGPIDRLESTPHLQPNVGMAKLSHELTPESVYMLYAQLQLFDRWIHNFDNIYKK